MASINDIGIPTRGYGLLHPIKSTNNEILEHINDYVKVISIIPDCAKDCYDNRLKTVYSFYIQQYTEELQRRMKIKKGDNFGT